MDRFLRDYKGGRFRLQENRKNVQDWPGYLDFTSFIVVPRYSALLFVQDFVESLGLSITMDETLPTVSRSGAGLACVLGIPSSSSSMLHKLLHI